MTYDADQPPSSQPVNSALTSIARDGDDAPWEVFHDPVTGQMKFVHRGGLGAELPPGSVPVSSIATTGFS